MRTSSAAALLLTLAACGAGDPAAEGEDPLAAVEAETRAEAAESGTAYCALDGAADFAPDCQIERTQGAEGLILTMRHRDGGFRRLLVTGDGRGLIAADGSEPATVTPVSDHEIEVAIASDRYRLPATVR